MMLHPVITALFAATLVPAPREFTARTGYCSADAPFRTVRDSEIPAEGYRLAVTPDGIEIASHDADGEFYARVTLSQHAETSADGTTNYPCCTISDSPRFKWRGCLIDEGRHFFGKETVKKMIDAYKMGK